MQTISAITFHFDPVEDRILLVGNLTSDTLRCDFWLTRSLTLKLIDAFRQLLCSMSTQVAAAPQEHRAGLAQFEHEQAQQNMQVQAQPEISRRHEAALLGKVDVSHKDGRYKLRLYPRGAHQEAQAVLTHDELHQVLSLLHRGALELEWGVENQLFDAQRAGTALQ